MTDREYHYKITGWRASLLMGAAAAVPCGGLICIGFILGRIS